MQLDPSMFADSEDSSDESDAEETHFSGRFIGVDSDSEGIKIHLNFNKSNYPYFKLFISNENSRKETYFTHKNSEEETDIIFIPLTQNSIYSVTIYLYNSEDNFKKNILQTFEFIPSIKAIGGSGEYTFSTSSTNPKADYNESTKTLTFNTITSSNSVYESRQTFDLYVYNHEQGQPIEVLEKYSNLKDLTASDNTYNVSLVLQDYCQRNNLTDLQFGLLEKMQFRKAGETDYLYEVIYYDIVFSRHEPYTYTRN